MIIQRSKCSNHYYTQMPIKVSLKTKLICRVPKVIAAFCIFSAFFKISLCSVGGLILGKTVSDPNFAGMAVFTPVINGKFLLPEAISLVVFLRVWEP